MLGGLTVTSVVGIVRSVAYYNIDGNSNYKIYCIKNNLITGDTFTPPGNKPIEYLDDIIFLSGSVLFSTILFGIFSASTAYAYICLRENEFSKGHSSLSYNYNT